MSASGLVRSPPSASDAPAGERPLLRHYGAIPQQLEYPAIMLHEAVARSAARTPDAVARNFLGTRSSYRELQADIERSADALAMLGPERGQSPQTAQALIAHCRERLLKWSCPREVEFRRELPLTRVGKVDYRALQREHDAAARVPA